MIRTVARSGPCCLRAPPLEWLVASTLLGIPWSSSLSSIIEVSPKNLHQQFVSYIGITNYINRVATATATDLYRKLKV